ncbi:MAG TPA: RNA-binding S4 domain-containing protein [Gammaproteobacteria bacterium]|nr:RNA-binding S4 domain-containing protein [Gammaproteobacteria bacterium]
MTRAEESDDDADRLRIDRWLWCARFFKSRSAAAEAVRGGHVRLNGQRVKPAHAVKIGDALQLTLAYGVERDVSVALIPARRGPAPEAAASYVESPESIERRRKAAEERAARAAYVPPTAGRPDKRTRRLLLRARQRGLSER